MNDFPERAMRVESGAPNDSLKDIFADGRANTKKIRQFFVDETYSAEFGEILLRHLLAKDGALIETLAPKSAKGIVVGDAVLCRADMSGAVAPHHMMAIGAEDGRASSFISSPDDVEWLPAVVLKDCRDGTYLCSFAHGFDRSAKDFHLPDAAGGVRRVPEKFTHPRGRREDIVCIKKDYALAKNTGTSSTYFHQMKNAVSSNPRALECVFVFCVYRCVSTRPASADPSPPPSSSSYTDSWTSAFSWRAGEDAS